MASNHAVGRKQQRQRPEIEEALEREHELQLRQFRQSCRLGLLRQPKLFEDEAGAVLVWQPAEQRQAVELRSEGPSLEAEEIRLAEFEEGRHSRRRRRPSRPVFRQAEHERWRGLKQPVQEQDRW